MELKDVLHFYLGAECRMTKNSYHAVHELRLSADHPFRLDGKLLDYFTQPTTKAELKPMLRKLSSMTEEEAIEVGVGIVQRDLGMFNRPWSPQQFVWLCNKHFDLFGLIESNQAIDINTKTEQQ